MKKLIIYLLIFALQLGNVSSYAFAQEATPSATLVPQATPTPVPNSTEESVRQLPDLSASQDQDLTSPLPAFPNAENKSSASIKSPPIIRNLAKRSFKADEKVEVNIDNADNSAADVTITDKNGEVADFDFFTIDNGSRKTVTVKPKREFKPGKYTITVTYAGQTFTQDFTWGVLAINTNKSIYLPNETAKIAMAVLDEFGNMVCDALLRLEIKAPDGQATTLSTDNGQITVNPQCQSKEITTVPDYESNYTVKGTGIYSMSLSAVTKNGTYAIDDAFEVQDSVPFDVERITATRIFPVHPYPVDLNITANQDFTGTIVESVPGDFAIDQSSSSSVPFAEAQTVSSTAIDALLGSSSAKLKLPFSGNYPISEEFGEKLKDNVEKNLYQQFNLAGHDGVDFDMPVGTPILAVDDGKVVMAGGEIYGTTVVIQHSWGKSYYGHLSDVGVAMDQEVSKGQEIALSGNTGITTGPHLHFGIKPNNPDMQNGYYGKIDPLPFLGIQSQADPASLTKLISWNVSLKKGDKITLGYFYKAPNISPQFYRIGALKFYENGLNIFSEVRQWQIAVDADGSGTNTVSPTAGVINQTGEQYRFTYKTGESVATGSGAFTISVPSGWIDPQTSSAGLAGYTTVDAISTGTSADVLDNADSNTNWTNLGSGTNHFACGNPAAPPVVETTTQPQGNGDLKCANVGVSTGDGFYKSISSSNWSSYTTVGAWVRTTTALSTLSHLRFSYDDTAALASPIADISLSTATIANVWVWETFPFGATTRTAIVSFGFTYGSNSTLDSNTVSVDYILIGPGSPVVTGSGPWTITTNILTIPATTGTIIVNYGSGRGAGGVTNSVTSGVHTFTTQSKIATNPKNSLTNISVQPTITLADLTAVMRHGKFFSGGVKQPFTF